MHSNSIPFSQNLISKIRNLIPKIPNLISKIRILIAKIQNLNPDGWLQRCLKTMKLPRNMCKLRGGTEMRSFCNDVNVGCWYWVHVPEMQQWPI